MFAVIRIKPAVWWSICIDVLSKNVGVTDDSAIIRLVTDYESSIDCSVPCEAPGGGIPNSDNTNDASSSG
jgi:hypothetical protein